MNNEGSRALSGAEKVFWAEVFSKDANRRSVALAYALVAIAFPDNDPEIWTRIDAAVLRKFKIKTERDFRAFQKKAGHIVLASMRQRTISEQPKMEDDLGSI